MSVVYGVMLMLSLVDDDNPCLAEVQQRLARDDRTQLVAVEDYAGGSKHPEFVALAAGVNFMSDYEVFAEFVISRDWDCPEDVVLIISLPDGRATKVYRPKGYES